MDDLTLDSPDGHVYHARLGVRLAELRLAGTRSAVGRSGLAPFIGALAVGPDVHLETDTNGKSKIRRRKKEVTRRDQNKVNTCLFHQ